VIRNLLIGLVALDVVVIVLGNILGAPARWPDIEVPVIGSLFASLQGEPLIHIAGEPGHAAGGIGISSEISISNSLLTMWIVMAVLIVVSFLGTRRLEAVPSGVQNFVELVVQGLQEFVQSTGGPQALRYFPLFGTLFLFLLLSNWLSVVPFVSQIPLLHAPTADYHTNFGLALVGWFAYQSEGVRRLGTKYFSRFFNFSGFKEGAFIGAIFVFVGLIELFSELFRMLTLTLRLWGNVLGGEIMLGVMAAVLWYIAAPVALPFVGLEVFIGLIQALIFSLLVLMYFILAIESHEEEHEVALAHAEEPHPQMTREVASV
jgi:F-type H+-transporting ATPase subunit a